jgi:hypothetical protein
MWQSLYTSVIDSSHLNPKVQSDGLVLKSKLTISDSRGAASPAAAAGTVGPVKEGGELEELRVKVAEGDEVDALPAKGGRSDPLWAPCRAQHSGPTLRR